MNPMYTVNTFEQGTFPDSVVAEYGEALASLKIKAHLVQDDTPGIVI